MSVNLRVADDRDVERLWLGVQASHLFESRGHFDRFRSAGPWRVLASSSGEGAVLERWRDHLDILAIKGIWGAPSELSSMITEIGGIAARQGYGRILSPLVPSEIVPAYESVGMHVLERLVTLRAQAKDVPQGDPKLASGTRLRLAIPEDMAEILDLDTACFNEFWRYEPSRIAERLLHGRVTVADSEQGIIGYTHATIDRGSGTIGRLAVSPGSRRSGVGTALLTDAMHFLARAGVGTMSLCTQEENAASRALYAGLGLRELAGRLVFLISGEEGAHK